MKESAIEFPPTFKYKTFKGDLEEKEDPSALKKAYSSFTSKIPFLGNKTEEETIESVEIGHDTEKLVKICYGKIFYEAQN